MRIHWLSQLANDIEAKYGREARDKIFGDIDALKDSHKCLSPWFDNFIRGMDELDDKAYLQDMMARLCPCGPGKTNMPKIVKFIKKSYEESETLTEFVAKLEKDGRTSDNFELHGNVLYLIKNLRNQKNAGLCGKGCHCGLAKYTDKYISDIFCYCCTVGHDGKPFKMALGDDLKVEFAYSLINGGKACASAIYLPEKKQTP